MVLKNVGIAMVCASLLAWSGASLADEYRPDEFLRLDLSRALLSPRPLGPPSEFAPVRVEAKMDRASEGALARAESTAESKLVKTKRIVVPAPGLRICVRRSRACTLRNRAALRAPSSCDDTAIRWTRKRWIRGFRCGHANLAASATGSGSGIEVGVTGSQLARLTNP